MIAIIDYDAGNTCSVQNALDRLGADYVLTDSKKTIKEAKKVIFPGVGHAASAMNVLKDKDLASVISSLTQPVLGICLGMQLLCQHSEEDDTKCLGIMALDVLRFSNDSKEIKFKIPHMGWNNFEKVESPLFKGIELKDYVYFVHSFYVPVNPNSIASTNYIDSFSAAIQKDNFYGVQFHPEKSGKVGERLLNNFLKL